MSAILPGDVGRRVLGPVRRCARGGGPQRGARDRPAAAHAVPRLDRRASSPATSASRRRSGARSARCSGRRSRTPPSWRCWRSSSSCRWRSSAGCSRRSTRAAPRPVHHRRRALGDRDPRVRVGRRADHRLLARPRAAAVDGAVPGGRLGLHADRVPAAARAVPRVRAVRLHRADGAGGDDRGARRGLHAHGDHQGPAAAHGAAQARAPQLAAADDRGGRDPDRATCSAVS